MVSRVTPTILVQSGRTRAACKVPRASASPQATPSESRLPSEPAEIPHSLSATRAMRSVEKSPCDSRIQPTPGTKAEGSSQIPSCLPAAAHRLSWQNLETPRHLAMLREKWRRRPLRHTAVPDGLFDRNFQP